MPRTPVARRTAATDRAIENAIKEPDLKIVEPPKVKTWQDMVNEARMPQVRKDFLLKFLPYIFEPTKKWAEALATYDPDAPLPERDQKEMLKEFFEGNPFGCRNKKMVRLLSILLKCKPEEIAPKHMTNEDGDDEDGDGAPDTIPLGIFNLATDGCAFKVVGRRAQIDNETRIAYFYRKDDKFAYYFDEQSRHQRIEIPSFWRRHQFTLENFRPATELEITEDFLKVSLERLHQFVHKRFRSELKAERMLMSEFVDTTSLGYDDFEAEEVTEDDEG